MKSIPAARFKAHCLRVMEEVRSKRAPILITKRGKPEVVMMSVEDYESLLETLDIQSDKVLMARLKKAEKDAATGKFKSLDEIHKELRIV